jgi:hypothetical protein
MSRYGLTEGLYVMSVMVFLFTGSRYVIADSRLYLKICFIPAGSVRISDILSVERSYNPVVFSPHATLSFSLRRLCIKFKKGSKHGYPYWLISPVREQEFLETLKSIHPDIHIQVPAKKGKWHILDWDF